MKFARRKPSPTRRSSTSWIRKTTRFAIYHRDGFDCLLCHGVFPLAYDGVGLSLDHIVTRAAGGSDAATNLVTACHSCNSNRKHARLPPARELELLTRAAMPLHRELGAHYARLYLACRDQGLVHPFTLRQIPKVLYKPYEENQESASWDPQDLEVAAE